MTDEQIRLWINFHRSQRKLGHLSKWKRDRLSCISGWDWDPQVTTVEQWVHVAERLAASNNGKIPPKTWLIRHGYFGLIHALKKRPTLFTHLPQDKRSFTGEEYVVLAEALAKENGGLVPCDKALIDIGHKRLVRAFRRHPSLFSHLRQVNGNTTTLPGQYERPPFLSYDDAKAWNKANKITTAAQYRSYEKPPSLPSCPKTSYAKTGWVCWSDFLGQLNRRAPEKWCDPARVIAEQHDGVLPHHARLKEINPGLAKAIRRHPDVFQTIPQWVANTRGTVIGIQRGKNRTIVAC